MDSEYCSQSIPLVQSGQPSPVLVCGALLNSDRGADLRDREIKTGQNFRCSCLF